MPHVSVITPAFNSEEFLEETYLSLQRQSHSDWTWIAVNDCSRDGTLPLLKRIASSDSRVKVLSNQENLGAAHSRNRGLEAAVGDYVAFLDADDRWISDKLSTQIDFMHSRDADASFSGYSLIDAAGRPTGKEIDTRSRGILDYADALRKRATIGCSTVMLRKEAIGNSLMPLIRTGQDYAFWLALMRKGIVFHHLAAPLSEYRITPGSISRNKFKKARRQWQIYRRIEGLGLVESTICFTSYAVRALIR